MNMHVFQEIVIPSDFWDLMEEQSLFHILHFPRLLTSVKMYDNLADGS